jgi:hypothetical protein
MQDVCTTSHWKGLDAGFSKLIPTNEMRKTTQEKNKNARIEPSQRRTIM